ncbi:MAG: aromatic amino acid DMT transporter YddG [Pirellulaceae bacterium]
MEFPCRQRRWATVAGLTAIVLWSTTVALTRSLSEQLGPLTTAASVYSIAGAAALLSLWRSHTSLRDIRRLPRTYLLGCGTLFVSYMIVLYLGLGMAQTRRQMLEVGLLNYLWPVLTLLFSVVLLGKSARWTLVPGTLLALAGIVLVVMPDTAAQWTSIGHLPTDNAVPRLLGVCAAFTWALYSALTRRWAADHTQGAVNLFLIATAAVLLPLCAVVPEPRVWSARSGIEAITLGAVTYVAYGLWDIAMRRGNIVFVAAASYFTPLLSTVASCLYLWIVPEPQLWWGCVLLIAGSALSWSAVSSDTTTTDQRQPKDIVP